MKTAFDSGINHRLELKAGYADEHSDETYLGLSEDDLPAIPTSAMPVRSATALSRAIGSGLPPT